MGRKERDKSEKLPEKLKHTRLFINATQVRMLEILLPEHKSTRRGYINEFEQGKREPSYPALVRLVKYLRLEHKMEIYVDHFVDDDMELPF